MKTNKIYITLIKNHFDVYSSLQECEERINSLEIPYRCKIYEIDLNNLSKKNIKILESDDYDETYYR